MSYSDVTTDALPIALSLCKGTYQMGVVYGSEALSGATLKGKASKYGARYAESRFNLLARLRSDPRLTVTERKAAHGKRVLVIIRCEADRVALQIAEAEGRLAGLRFRAAELATL
jgi:hypothetical protein